MAIPQGRRASPWPFVAMMGMAGTFFLYAVSGLLAPWYGVVLLLLVWVVLFVVACLKASRVLFITFDANGKQQKVRAPRDLRQYGRIRQISNAENGDLLVTTDNGGGNDVILRVSPR